MRFVYIDSQGREVPIPTVEALALRIELGAITDTTRFYDPTADLWAPAGEHEIFRSLTRELELKSEGFVAPPPATPAASPPDVPDARVAEPPPAATEAEPEAVPVPEAAGEPPALSAPDDVLGGLDFGLTIASGPTDDELATPLPAQGSDSDSLGLETALDLSIGEDEATLASVVPEPDSPDSVDFGGFGGLLGDDNEEEEVEGAPAPAGGELGLEDAAMGLDGMEMEQPLSEFPLDQSEWKDPEPASDEASHADLPPPPEQPGDGDDEPDRPTRARPAARPEQKKSSGIPALLVLGTVALLLVRGSWFGWNSFRNRQAAQATAPEEIDPPVTIPTIPAELEPRLQAVAAAAKTDWLAALRTQIPSDRGLPIEPAREWLGGSYLADASLGEYWGALSDYLADIQARDEEMFVSFFRARLDSAAVTGPEAETLANRARAGFQAARPDRRVVYRQLGAVIDAAMGLHEFLVTNEDEIEYDPAASGASRDPVLEAVPATPELGAAMWDRVDRITESLDGLGALDRVTTDRLLELFVAQLRAVEIR